jgi:hypothetical protein
MLQTEQKKKNIHERISIFLTVMIYTFLTHGIMGGQFHFGIRVLLIVLSMFIVIRDFHWIIFLQKTNTTTS